MNSPKKILLQTTIPATKDDWSIARFSRLGALLSEQRDERGVPVYDVVMRDRDAPGAPDSLLSTIDKSDFDQLWLFAVDTGNGLTSEDCEAISRFRRSGRGLFVTRDHMDLGSSLCTLGGVGKAHYFHSRHPDPDPERGRHFLAQLPLGLERGFPGNRDRRCGASLAHERSLTDGRNSLSSFASPRGGNRRPGPRGCPRHHPREEHRDWCAVQHFRGI
jgi:hypothetical protein